MNKLNLVKTNYIIVISFFALLLFSCDSTNKGSTESNNSEVEKPMDTIKAAEPIEKAEVIDTIRGIDVSHFQGEVDWAKIKEDGIVLGIAKSTQGITYTDPDFKENWEKIEKNGLYRGTYHFYVAQDNPIDQAKHYVTTVKSLGERHMPPILDLEGSDIGGLSVAEYQKNVLEWLIYVEDSLGMKPLIYTNNPFGNMYLDNSEFTKYDLWIAEYGSDKAKIPTAWKSKGWVGWQFSQSGKEDGVEGAVDESRFLSSVLVING